ncbi:paired amphipathic helix protein [Medicago truncatula]|uniref:Paired amphipathic helix protein n=1 Tax=Medicago truncatula TaxID=3880 RepID=G7LEM6_MEDTR|nr:paired amphipathic helix protein [Medicago truncatula]
MSTSQGGKKLTEDDAFAYLKAVKDVFRDKMENYSYFLKIMKDYKDERINYHDVVMEVKELFKGHNDLITGFNIFAPSGYQIPISHETEQLDPMILDECEMTIPSEELEPLNAQSPQMMLGGEEDITTPLRNEPFGGPEHANEFVSKVKTRYEGDRHVFKSFLYIMNMLTDRKKTYIETYYEAAALLEGHTDLQDELIMFFPGV